MLVFAAASVRADNLHLDVIQDELLGGEYYPDNSNSSWYIKFTAKVEEEEIVSVSEIWTKKAGYLVEMTSLKIPYRNKYTIRVDNMRTRVISAAKATAQVVKLSWLLPATVDKIVEAYWNMANSLVNKTVEMGINQVRFAVMYHSIIIQAALRVMNGARKTKDICQVSPDYDYTKNSLLFICMQDLLDWKDTQLPHKRHTRDDDDDDDDNIAVSGNGSQCPTRSRKCMKKLIISIKLKWVCEIYIEIHYNSCDN